MTIDTQKLRDLIAGANAATEAHGETDWYAPPGTIYIDPNGIGKADFEFIAFLSPERATALLDHIDAQAAQLTAYPADWRVDSSLETWFPLTAEQLNAQAAEIAEARSQIEHLDRQNNELREALEESQSLFAAMCHEVRPLEEIQAQMVENRAALSGESKC